MPKSSSVYTRVEPELKEQVEYVLSRLGIPMANAINMFFHQIVLHNGIPFDVILPQNTRRDYSSLSKDEFDDEMIKGFADLEAGRTVTSSQERENMRRKYRA